MWTRSSAIEKSAACRPRRSRSVRRGGRAPCGTPDPPGRAARRPSPRAGAIRRRGSAAGRAPAVLVLQLVEQQEDVVADRLALHRDEALAQLAAQLGASWPRSSAAPAERSGTWSASSSISANSIARFASRSWSQVRSATYVARWRASLSSWRTASKDSLSPSRQRRAPPRPFRGRAAAEARLERRDHRGRARSGRELRSRPPSP